MEGEAGKILPLVFLRESFGFVRMCLLATPDPWLRLLNACVSEDHAFDMFAAVCFWEWLNTTRAVTETADSSESIFQVVQNRKKNPKKFCGHHLVRA